jgi:SAM-dependent methyltransferase
MSAPLSRPDVADSRLDRERDFHNGRFGAEADPRAHLDKLYLAASWGYGEQARIVRDRARGAEVLEYGCADGALALSELGVAQLARRFEGIDISDEAVCKARARAGALGLGHAAFRVMNAEALDYPDASFDLVYGRGILHHLVLDRAYAEIARVLRPGGLAVFTEPMGHNPLLNLYRRLTPKLRTSDEHPLLDADIRAAETCFSQVEATYFGLATLACVPFRGTALFAPVERAAIRLDRALLAVPALGRHAWHVLLCCRR